MHNKRISTITQKRKHKTMQYRTTTVKIVNFCTISDAAQSGFSSSLKVLKSL